MNSHYRPCEIHGHHRVGTAAADGYCAGVHVGMNSDFATRTYVDDEGDFELTCAALDELGEIADGDDVSSLY